MPTEIIMPQLGESVVDGTVIEWLKYVGEQVEEYESIVRVSTDKVDTEIPAPVAGVLLAIYVEPDQTVNAGVVLGVIGSEGEEVSTAVTEQTPMASPAPQGMKGLSEQTSAGEAGGQGAHITPVVARMAQIHALDLSRIRGTGRGGRITKKDVEAYLKEGETGENATTLAPWEQPGSGDLFKPTVEYGEDVPNDAGSGREKTSNKQAIRATPKGASDGAGDVMPISPMRRMIAQHMVDSKRTAPHVTTVFEADLSAIVKHRDQHKEAFGRQGVRLTFTPYFVQACVKALQAHPIVNARWLDGDAGIYQAHGIHIGMAVALDEGLIVPVLKDAQDYNLMGLARQVNDLSERARQRRLMPDEVRGGTFSITNHGVSGSLFATPIINQPQSAILGIGAIEKRVKVIDDAIAIRPCAYLSLTFDHRLIDGATADNFVMSVIEALGGDF